MAATGIWWSIIGQAAADTSDEEGVYLEELNICNLFVVHGLCDQVFTLLSFFLQWHIQEFVTVRDG